MYSAQGSPSAPPGWYPDPWAAPGTMRWWTGRDWTGHTVAGSSPAQPYKPTDGYAVASLVTSSVGLSPVGIILGLVSKRRIRRAGGGLDGGGMATAGIVVGSVFLALTVGVIALALTGSFDQVNSDDYAGEEARIATVIDRFEDHYEDADGHEICRDLFTPALAEAYATDGGCEVVWGDEVTPRWAEIDIDAIQLHPDDTATVSADDESSDEEWEFVLVRTRNDEWRIDSVE